ncbi:protein of unknown function [Taphrina deformans PYCC 5710]|uniref:Pre-mRNA processing factor 4 (PRP4)-like domain-containing protein n=1 Tax=Taphrina deformans (strain PYCC 5710 / ATCC 11124 / CBS 356.35 / IMI 108563 / JCM 9778 / NBRC 8474) TaxID=1097556 RepID=R4XDS0_TAPDE|nr:protein of unknown function [Taphrina deformans PYCC 5710]|eukprot:CCG84016.1 protein of unknown function [Taphrina deformans PYCC 5710]
MLGTDYSYQIQGQDASAALAEFSRREHARTVVVPTDDNKVKARLRELEEPIILFGEGPADRRDRLRYLLSIGNGDTRMTDSNDNGDDEAEEEEYYTAGSEDLLLARRKIASHSLPRARDRIARQKQESQVPLSRLIAHRKAQNARLRTLVSQGSQIAADRPVSIARFSPDSRTIATGSWAGDLRFFDASTLEERRRVTGHVDKVSGLSWHPHATTGLPPSVCNVVTGGGEGDVCLWALTGDAPLATMKGHGGRVARVEFHPSGHFIGSASFDGTWRLWDVETTAELLLQQGHSHEVYAISFQDDGALVATAGLDAIGRVWDLRSGRTVMVLDGHMKAIQGLGFSGNGYQLATGSADDTVKIWDLRQVRNVATIPAHKSLVSDVRFFHGGYAGRQDNDEEMVDGDATSRHKVNGDSTYLATSGYDGAVNIWSADDWTLVKSLVGPAEKKVMSVDISRDNQQICSSGFDRTLRLWSGDV